MNEPIYKYVKGTGWVPTDTSPEPVNKRRQGEFWYTINENLQDDVRGWYCSDSVEAIADFSGDEALPVGIYQMEYYGNRWSSSGAEPFTDREAATKLRTFHLIHLSYPSKVCRLVRLS